MILWKPGLLEESIQSISRSNKNVSILHTFNIKNCDIWYVRFGLDFSQKVNPNFYKEIYRFIIFDCVIKIKVLSLGDTNGRVYVWDLDVDDPEKIKYLSIEKFFF